MNMHRARPTRGGFVLPAVIGALVIIGLLVTAGFFVAQQELRMGVAARQTNLAFNIAQAGANDVMANWNGYQLGQIAQWDTATITETHGSVGEWEVTIHNTNNFVYFLTATGRVTNAGIWSGATRTIGIVTKMIFADIDPPGALTTRGDVEIKGTAGVYGDNGDPVTWAGYCGGFDTNDMPGIVTDGSGTVTTTGKNAEYDGNPPSVVDPAIVDDTFTDFGNLSWTELVAIAQAEGKDISSLGASVSGAGPVLYGSGNCDESVLTNWGDTNPVAPCGWYFPLIYHDNDLRIQGGGLGQGLLLVEGDLDLRGNFEFFGIVIVQGAIATQGNGNRIVGAVMASNGLSIDQPLTGGSQIQFSHCAVQRAILNNANLSRARPVAERSWIDLTSAAN